MVKFANGNFSRTRCALSGLPALVSYTVTSVYKSGDRSDPFNYRPISLTCICCKVMEHLILSHVSKHLASNNILTDAQHGFRQGLSTSTQLSSIVHDWSSVLQKRSQVDVVFLDFQKAFDRVPHHRLCMKLQYYGISGDSLNWIMSFLTERKQAVVIKLLMELNPHGEL